MQVTATTPLLSPSSKVLEPIFLYYGGYHPEMGLLMRQGAEQGLKVRFMGPEGVGNADINAIAGPAVEGMLVTLPADFTQRCSQRSGGSGI